MTFSFDVQEALVVVNAELEGPSGTATLRLALDTGATSSLLNLQLLTAVGYDPATTPERVQITTGSGVAFAPRVRVARLRALGQEFRDFPVVGHTLPPNTGVDGLMGLDFLRGLRLTVDFRRGEIELT